MADYLTTDTELTSIANAIRSKGGTSAPLAYPAGFVSAIEAIESGIDTSDADATASDMLSGKTAYVDGQKITGNISSKSSSNLTASGATVTVPAGYYSTAATKTISSGSTTQNTPSINLSTGLVTATTNVTAGYQAASTKSNSLQLTTQAAQTITPGTTNKTIASGRFLTGTQTIKGDANLVASNIAYGVSIFGVTGTHSGGGGDDITDFIENGNAWISYENLSATKIRPYAFFYCHSLTSVNFPACTYIGGSAFGDCYRLISANFSACTDIGTRAFYPCYSLASVSFPVCTNIGTSAFTSCTSLTSVNFPACTKIGSDAFQFCSSLESVSFPACTYIDRGAFYACHSLTSVNFPVCTKIGSDAFQFCRSLEAASFPKCTSIRTGTFNSCYKLISLYLTGSSFVSLANSSVFSSTPIGGYSASAGKYGSIYVPASMLASYKTRTNWTYFSSRMKGV